jgi:hypothetical protein
MRIVGGGCLRGPLYWSQDASSYRPGPKRQVPQAKGKRIGRPRNPITIAQNVTEAVRQINSGARRFYLREPIDLTVTRRGPYFFVGYTPLAIEGYGQTASAALEAFVDVFSTTWDAYSAEEDRRLSRDARQLKRQLRQLVTEIEPA